MAVMALSTGCSSGAETTDEATATSTPSVPPAEQGFTSRPSPADPSETAITGSAVAEESDGTVEPGEAAEQASRGPVLAAEGTRTKWSGTIDEHIGFTMWLAQQGRFVRGEITYDTVGEPITLVGVADPALDFYVIREFGPNGRVSGTMTFDYAGQPAITDGLWGDLPLVADYRGVDELPYFFDPLVRPGRYGYSFAPFPEDVDECCGPVGILLVSDVGRETVTIEFDNHRGAPSFNLASLEPTAVHLTANRAVFDGARDELRPDCAFEITVFDGFAFVSHLDDRFNCGFGNAAGIEGAYVLIEQAPD